jgi:AbrB family looped-hinge helix DNA binding protein
VRNSINGRRGQRAKHWRGEAAHPGPPQALASKVGRRGAVVLPAKRRRRFGIEGSFVIEEHEGGILIRPATLVPFEVYAPERRTEFLLNNATDLRPPPHSVTGPRNCDIRLIMDQRIIALIKVPQ